jgi:hypothetical protein
MKKNRMRIAIAGMLFFWAAWMLFTGTSSATLPIQKNCSARKARAVFGRRHSSLP